MIDKFIKDGWIIVDIPDAAIVHEIISDFKNFTSWNLGDLHVFCDDAATRHKHVSLSEHFWSKEYGMRIGQAMLPVVQRLIGLDVMVQYMPYLRIARPNHAKDNIGFHKDTQYGQNPYEVAVHIPFVDLDEKSAIRVISGSHVMPESAFPKVTGDSKAIEKGSIDNRMGRPYMPKNLAIPDGMETTPLCLKVGQAAIFSPAIFHGQEINEGEITRVSIDMRFISSRAPIDIRKGKVHAGYVPLAQSPVEIVAEKYYEAQK